MKIAGNTVMLSLHSSTGSFYPVLVWDDNDLVLIDTGLPHMREELFKKIEECGFSPSSVTKVLITHQDIDHFGNANYFAENGAIIYSSEIDAPYIEGKKKLEKLVSLEKKESRTEIEESILQLLKENVDKCSVNVDIKLKGNEILDFCGGISLMNLEGHTSGHVGFFLNESKILIVGDAAELIDGKLVPPDPNFSTDPIKALLSFQMIENLSSKGIVCYHGGFLKKN